MHLDIALHAETTRAPDYSATTGTATRHLDLPPCKPAAEIHNTKIYGTLSPAGC
jgi:hypothetical protein